MIFFKRKAAASSSVSPERAMPDGERLIAAPQLIHQSEGYLQGQLLVATPLIGSSCFHKSSIYLFAHNQEGAMGVIINQPIETVDYGTLLEECEMPERIAEEDISVYYGGPVDRHRGFVLHSNDYSTEGTLFRSEVASVTASTKILRDMMAGNGPRKALLAVGCAGWGPGQLEQELEENSWITVPASEELIFDIDNDMKWGMASQSLGIDMNFYSHLVGHA